MANDHERLRLQERLLGWARDLYHDAATLSPSGGAVVVAAGSATAWVQVAPAGDDLLVTVSSVVAVQPQLTPELLRLLLTRNHDELFGRFCLAPDGNVLLTYTADGSIDRQAFQRVLVSMLETADQIDDAIVASWGGRRSADVLHAAPSPTGSAGRERFLF